MRDEPITLEAYEAEAAQAAFDNWKADESERRYYRQRELDLFFEWERDELDDLIRRDPSEAYEAFHERRLALGLTEDQLKAERGAFIARQETPVAVCDLF